MNSMPNANEVVASSSSRPSPRIMPGAFSPPSQRRRSNIAPRRTTSAPDLRSAPSFTTSTSSDDHSSSVSSSSSRSSYSPREWRPHETLTHLAPLPLSHRAPRTRPARSATEPPPAAENPQQRPASLESAARTLEEVHRVIRELQNRERRRGARGLWIAARGFFGYGPEGSTARKDLVSLIGKFLFSAGQIGATIGLLYIAARDRSPTQNAVNEWQACRRPLGIWCAIWCVRVVLGCVLALWGYRRKNGRPTEATDRTEGGHTDDAVSHASESRDRRPSRSGGVNIRPQPREVEVNRHISAVTFTRLTTLLSLLSLTWFVTAHILIYTSVHTCRMSAPHLWWLTFGIICIGYLVIVEVILVAFIVFILGPLLFLFLNLILICMGRHPIRHPNHINPEIGKLPQKAVDSIPLVLYIPAPNVKEPIVSEPPPVPSVHSGEVPTEEPTPQIAIPEPAHLHSYPPTSPISASPSPASVPQRPSRRFTFRRIHLRKRAKGDKEKGKAQPSGRAGEEQGYSYEDKWERGDYPFVKLEGNRAACAICLCDFEEPRRVRYSVDSRPPEDLDQAEKGLQGGPGKVRTEDGALKLTDAGEGAQPLRLLACAHVFHKSCLDPWLTEVSGRCPVCQRPVEVDSATTLAVERRDRRRVRENE